MSTVHDLLTPASTHAGTPGNGKFPATAYPGAGSYFGDYARELARAASSVESASLDQAASILLDAYTRGARVFSCGNGGSAAIANHMQCDQVKGIRTGTDLAPRFVSLSANVEVLTAIANDLAFEDVFAYQLQSQSEPGDVLIAVSSSGRSPNIVRALTLAHDKGLRTIALTGFSGGGARKIADVAIHVDSTNYGIIEDLHQTITHVLAQYLRQSRMTADVISSSVF
jgi:phosphoheptose isomerase